MRILKLTFIGIQGKEIHKRVASNIYQIIWNHINRKHQIPHTGMCIKGGQNSKIDFVPAVDRILVFLFEFFSSLIQAWLGQVSSKLWKPFMWHRDRESVSSLTIQMFLPTIKYFCTIANVDKFILRIWIKSFNQFGRKLLKQWVFF